MGNCVFGGDAGVIRVVKSNGGTMEFCGQITAGCIANQFPGHAIFPSHDLFWRPLFSDEILQPGNSYYLLPISDAKLGEQQQVGHVRSKSITLPTTSSSSSSSTVTPYRISFDYDGILKRSFTDHGFSSLRYNNRSDVGFWKVKLVISPQQLLEILSQDAQTHEFVENMRAVAKCGNGLLSSSSNSNSSSSFLDQWSFSSSRNGSKKDVVALLDV